MNGIPLKNKLAWQCRRGMLELDVILIPFLNDFFDHLDTSQQNTFALFLEQADPDIYSWIMGYSDCQDAEFKEIIVLIRDKMQVAG